jgi:hypothetical protein
VSESRKQETALYGLGRALEDSVSNLFLDVGESTSAVEGSTDLTPTGFDFRV